MDFITAFNSIVTSVSATVLIDVFNREKKKHQYIFLLISLFADNLLFCMYLPEVSKLSFYIMGVMAFIFMKQQGHTSRYSAFANLTTLSILFAVIMPIGSIMAIFFDTGELKALYIYNIAFGGALIMACLILNYKTRKVSLKKSNDRYEYEIISCFLFLLTVDFIIPKLPVAQDIRSYSYITLCFFIFVICIATGMAYIYKQDMSNLKLKENQALLEKNNRYYKQQQEKIIIQNHDVKKTIRSILGFILSDDMAGLRRYYKDFINPIYENIETELKSYDSLKMLENTVIYNVLSELINKAKLNGGISLGINIVNPISCVSLDDESMFKICSNFCENAFEEVMHQKNGTIQIDILMSENKVFVFSIHNSIEGKLSAPKPENTHKGFEIINSIKANHPNIDIHIERKVNIFIQILEVKNV